MQNTAAIVGTEDAFQVGIERTPLILRLDVTGQPVRWVPWQDAVTLETRSMIAWSAGEHLFTFLGGHCRRTGERSRVSVSSIIAVRGRLSGVDGDRAVAAGIETV